MADERIYPCPHCPGLLFATENEQSHHRKSIHQKTCTVTFASDGVKVAVDRDAETAIFPCPRCPMRYVASTSFIGHARVCEGNDGGQVEAQERSDIDSSGDSDDDGGAQGDSDAPLTCVHCPKLTFSDEAALRYHHTYIHMHAAQASATFGSDGTTIVVQRDVKTGLFLCTRCPMGSKQQRGLRNHTKTCTAAPPAPSSSSSSGSPATSTADIAAARKLCYCSHCPELSFTNAGRLSWHRSVTHQTKTTVRFGNDGSRVEIYRNEETDKFSCTRCAFSTQSSQSLHAHANNACTAPPPLNDHDAAHSHAEASSALDRSSLSPIASGSASRNDPASTPAGPLAKRSFPCSRCPELSFESFSKLGYHQQTHHQQQVTVKFSNGDVVVLERDAESKAFHCPRCPRRSKPPITIQRHVAKCPGATLQLADGTIDDKLDLDALKELDLFYDTTYCALICVPCEAAVTLDRLPEHWVTPAHKGKPHDLADVRRAMGAHIHVWPSLLARPDPYGSALPFLEWIMGYRCTACDWCGKRPSQTHWNSKHALELGGMPEEMEAKVKLQRWNPQNAYFDMERKGASPSLQPQPTISKAAELQRQSAFPQAIGEVSSRPSGRKRGKMRKLGILPDATVAAGTVAPAQSSQSQVAPTSRALQGASTSQASQIVATQPTSRVVSGSAVAPVSTSKPAPRSAPSKSKAKQQRRAALVASSLASFDSDVETASSSSRVSWQQGSDSEDDDIPAPDFDVYPWEAASAVADDDAEAEWDRGEESDQGEAPDFEADQAASPRTPSESEDELDESDWEGPMVIIEVPRKSVDAAARARQEANASKDAAEQAVPKVPDHSATAASASSLRGTTASSSASHSPLSARQPASSSIAAGSASSASTSTRATTELADGSMDERDVEHRESLGKAELDSLTDKSLRVESADAALDGALHESQQHGSEVHAQSSAPQLAVQPPQQQVANFLSNLLSLASSVLAPKNTQQQIFDSSLQREPAADPAEVIPQTQRLLANSTSEPSNLAAPSSSFSDFNRASGSSSLALGSLITSQSSWTQPDSMQNQHADPQSSSSVSPALPNLSLIGQGKQRVRSPSASDGESISNKRCKLDQHLATDSQMHASG